MSWHDLIPIIMVILGIVLFLYGANYYDPITGYAGLAWFFGGIIVEIVFRFYKYQLEKE
jgi:hypothetical protein